MGKTNDLLKRYLTGGSLWQLKIYNRLSELYVHINTALHSDKKIIEKMYRSSFGREINWTNPITLNEKMSWLKLYEHDPFHTIAADKYEVRKYIAETFGEEYLIPLLYQTEDYHDIIPENIPNVDCIMKTNHGCGGHQIFRGNMKYKIDYELLREKFRHNLAVNYYGLTREWQYKNIKPRIIIEKLLETKEGKIPNDYKLHFINGEFQFIYISYDREGVNDRCIYDRNWNRLPFMWVGKQSYRPSLNTTDVPKPSTFEKMIEFGSIVAKRFKLVRVDFYDVDGKLYFGEITLHHGSGGDTFFPEEYDTIYGNKLKL